MPAVNVEAGTVAGAKPDMEMRIYTYVDGVKYVAEIEVWRGDVGRPDDYVIMCEFGWFQAPYPKGLTRCEVRSMAIRTVRELVAEARERFDGWSERVPGSECEHA